MLTYYAQNITKAKEEIAKLENEAEGQRATDDAKKVAQEHAGVNGKVSAESELSQEKDAAADAADELKKASLEDTA